MNETDLKTRHGLILQGVLAEALTRAGFKYVMDPQYDPTCEKPDFLIPDDQTPKYLVEVHQTEARDSFRMKTLRAFTAVAEGKAYYNNDMISVNVLFGDPATELPPANVKAMCSFFDVNVIPRQDAKNRSDMVNIENASLAVAGEDGKSVKDGVDEVIKTQSSAIVKLGQLMKSALKPAVARSELNPLWNMERKRTSTLKKSPVGGSSTYYKRMMLRSLYLKDDDFDELRAAGGDPGVCSTSVQDQVLMTGLAELSEEIDGDYYDLDPEFKKFLEDPDGPRLRSLCKDRLDAVPEMKWFFEDIRDLARREQMASLYIEAYSTSSLEAALEENILNDTYGGIRHGRSWLVDLLTRSLGISLNQLSRKVFTTGKNTGGFGDPISHIVPKTARFLSLSEEVKRSYVVDILAAYDDLSRELDIGLPCLEKEKLSEELLKLRLNGVVKLRKLDPLLLITGELCNRISLKQEKITIPSVVGDLARSKAAGRFEAYQISSSNEKRVMMNAVATHDNNGDHKSKEWGARRLASLYRYTKSGFHGGEYSDALFVIDGDWTDKDVARLYRDGWNHVCRLGELEEKLTEIFELEE